jgi:hypothetical protein
MGQPRAYDPQDAAEFAAEFWKRIHTPPAEPCERPESLAETAARLRDEAIGQGRATPRPAPTEDEVERARAERIAKAAADEETRLELRRAAKRSKPDES